MATPITGAIGVSCINTLFGRSSTAQFSFSDACYKKLICVSSCACICINKGHASAYINSTTTTVNIATSLFSSPSTATTYRVLLGSSAVVGSSSTGSYALDTGQLPSGSSLVINNYGKIQGAGGASSGGTGGNALRSNYSNQTVTINNKSGAYIQAGGGGGGQGGTGGTGGKGGTGQYISSYTPTYSWVYQYSRTSPYSWAVVRWIQDASPQGFLVGCWSGSNIYLHGPNPWGCSESQNYSVHHVGYQFTGTDSKSYIIGCYQYATSGSGCCGAESCVIYSIGQYQHTGCTPNYSYSCGGNGGGGGAGGAGGVGQGYGQSAGSGSTGSGGSSGSGGGTNAGSGGTGGTGGSGGAGGAFGASGTSGSSGSSGATGNNGNYGSGSSGSGGSSGSSAGGAGNYLVKGSSTTTLNNSGTVSGGLA
jgi:hypothetical protein